MRISLKSTLLILAILGAGAGLLGRLFMSNPRMFFQVSSLLVTIVPFLAAIATIGWIGRKHRSRALGIWTVLLLLTPPIGMGSIAILQNMGRGSQGLGVLSSKQILNVNLPKAIDEPWVWRELEARVKSGDLSSEEVDVAFQKLTAHLKKKKQVGPLSWQRGFLKAVRNKKLGSDKELLALCEAYNGAPKARLIGANHINVEFGNVWSDNSGLGLELLWKVTEVLIDDQPIASNSQNHFQERALLRLENPLPSDKTVTLKLDCAYVPAEKMIGLDITEPVEGVMPTPVKRWTQTISTASPATLTNASLITDAKKDPTSEITIERLVVQNGGLTRQPDASQIPENEAKEAIRKLPKKLILKTELDQAMEVDVCFDVFLHIDESTMVNMGHLYVHHDNNTTSGGGSTLNGSIDQLDEDVAVVDVELVPDLNYANERGIFKEIWGKKVMLYDIPLERLDLEAR